MSRAALHRPREARIGKEAPGIEPQRAPISATPTQVHPHEPSTPLARCASIATRLLWFLAIALVPSIILTVVTAYLPPVGRNLVHDRLMVIADAKTTQLRTSLRATGMSPLGQALAIVAAVTRLGELAKVSASRTACTSTAATPTRSVPGWDSPCLRVSQHLYFRHRRHFRPCTRGFDGTNLLTGPMKGRSLLMQPVYLTLLRRDAGLPALPGSKPAFGLRGRSGAQGRHRGRRDCRTGQLAGVPGVRGLPGQRNWGDHGRDADRRRADLRGLYPLDQTSAFRLKIPLGEPARRKACNAVRGKRDTARGSTIAACP